MKEARQYKQLQTQLNTMLGDAEALKIAAANKQREYNQKLQAIDNLRREMAKLNKSDSIKVSEHALLRYLERVQSMSVESIEDLILSEQVVSFAKQLGGNGTYPHEDGFSVVMKNFTITTIIK